MAVVYQHRRKDTNEVFYIGAGKDRKRAYYTYGRSSRWGRVVSKFGYEVDILIEGISLEDAYTMEVGLIQSYGRLDLGTGNLINHTDGGEGLVNRSKELLQKQSNTARERGVYERTRNRMITNNPNHYPEVIEKIRESKLGDSNPAKRPEVRKKIGMNNPRRSKVVCIEDGKTFNSRLDACKYYNIDSGDMSGHLLRNSPKDLKKRSIPGGLHFKHLA